MSEPVVTCKKCGRIEYVKPSGRGFPPDTAKRKLSKICKANGCESDPVYTAGMGLRRIVGQSLPPTNPTPTTADGREGE